MRVLLLALLTLMMSPLAFAQDGGGDKFEQDVTKYDDLSVGKQKKLAKKLEKEGSYINAVMYLENVYEKKGDNKKIVYKLAWMNMSLRDYVKAEKYYGKLLEIDDDYDELARFHYARAMKMNGKCAEAKVQFDKFASEYEGDDESAYKTLAKAESDGCAMANDIMGTNTGQKVEKVTGDVNTAITEYSPKVVDDNTMMFASLRSDTAINLDQTERPYRSDIYTSTKSGMSGWGEPMKMGAPFIDKDAHLGNAVYSADGQTIYFTKCYEQEDLSMRCDIYMSEKKEDGTWGDPKSINSVNKSGFSTTHPAIGEDENGNEVLYFASNRGSIGDFDLFYATRGESGFSGAKALGNTINTVGDEVTPFYDKATGNLYFSSTGHPGIGGFDVFKSEGNLDTWMAPENLGVPVNSTADDIYLALDEEGIEGYMVSNRPGTTSKYGQTCCDDIFTAYLGGRTLYLKGYYAMKGDPEKKPINGVEASLYMVNGESFDFVTSTTTANDKMFYMELEPGRNYKMNGTKEGYYPGVDEIAAPEIKKNDTIFQVFYLEPITKQIVVYPVYFAFDKSEVRPLYQDRMDSLISALNAHPEWSLKVEGHTDSKGSEAYNMGLSERRAKAAAKYLTDNGIKGERLDLEWFGESQPRADNKTASGEDNPDGRAINRRVDFKIVIEGDSEFIIKYNTDPPPTNE